MQGLSTHAKGFLLTLIGVIVLTPDTLLIRLANMDVWQMTFWRGTLMSTTILAAFALIYKGDFFKRIKAIGRTGIAIIFMLALNSLTFVLSLEYASVAKVLIIIAITPMLAALMSILFLKEPVKLGTWVAILISFIGIAIVVSGDFASETDTTEIYGSFFAFLTSLGMAGAFTLTRSKPDINMVPATALNGLLISIVLFPVVWPLQMTDAQMVPMLTIGFLILPISFALLALGPRYIPAPEVGLLLLLETCIGPLWVWFILDEKPSTTVFIGGVVVVTTLAGHAIWSLKQSRKRKRLG